MKVLQICPAYYPAVSIGGPIFSTLTFSELITRENELTTLTTNLGLDIDQLKSIKFNEYIKLCDRHTIVYKKFQGYPHFTFSISSFFWLVAEFKKYDLIVLQGIWNFPFIISSILAKIYKKKYIVFPHGQLYKETFNLKSGRIKKLFFILFIKSMLKNATYIIFTTEDEQKQVLDFLELNVRFKIIPNIVKKSHFNSLIKSNFYRNKFDLKQETKVILHFGRISKKKGIEFTLHALKKLIIANHNVKLLVVGGDDEGYKKELDTLINELDLNNYVLFTGLLDRESSKMALMDSDIFILPSYSENFGIAVVEAMLCRIPVIISDRVGISEKIKQEDAGIVINFEDIENSLPIAIEKLILNDSFRIELGEKGQKFAVNHYDTEVVYEKFQDLMRNLN